MGIVLELSGKTFGLLTVLYRLENDKHGKSQWVTLCKCGFEKKFPGSSLTGNKAVSCGCLNIKNNPLGKTYGKLTVLKRADKIQKGKSADPLWECICSCGKPTTKATRYLLNAHNPSCGCGTEVNILTGQQFGDLVVVKEDVNSRNKHTCHCECSCGNTRIVIASQLNAGKVRYCKEHFDIVNKRFGKLIAINPAPSRNGRTHWMCKCDCGGSKVIARSSLISGLTRSCGCLLDIPDLVGQVFGYLTVARRALNLIIHNSHSAMWYCTCKCGGNCVKSGNSLRSSKLPSCGCAYEPEDLMGQSFGLLTVIGKTKSTRNKLEWIVECECGETITATFSALTKNRVNSCGIKRNHCWTDEEYEAFNNGGHSAVARLRDPEGVKAYRDNHKRQNPALYSSYGAKRRARLLTAMPSWANPQKILDIYTLRNKLRDEEGVSKDVHHIVPLVSKIVCGLHCEDNLTVIDSAENQSINNRYWPDMPTS
ncbi:MAG: hypothetical protein MJK13_10565 [Pseudomonadales bacterium]|nr:hypothetical protein [Pseudomonadales bacterium]